jgi:hypothetical protein
VASQEPWAATDPPPHPSARGTQREVGELPCLTTHRREAAGRKPHFGPAFRLDRRVGVALLLCAMTRTTALPSPHDELQPFYSSITSSAIANKVGGGFRPSALAVFGLMTNSNLFDRMRPVYAPIWQAFSLISGP